MTGYWQHSFGGSPKIYLDDGRIVNITHHEDYTAYLEEVALLIHTFGIKTLKVDDVSLEETENWLNENLVKRFNYSNEERVRIERMYN